MYKLFGLFTLDQVTGVHAASMHNIEIALFNQMRGTDTYHSTLGIL